MDWEGRSETSNVEDRRSLGRTGLAVGGGIGAIILMLVGAVLGLNPQTLSRFLNQNQQGASSTDPEEEKQAHFTKVIFHDTEVVWDDLFRRMGRRYEKPVLVLFSGSVESACNSWRTDLWSL